MKFKIKLAKFVFYCDDLNIQTKGMSNESATVNESLTLSQMTAHLRMITIQANDQTNNNNAQHFHIKKMCI